MKDINQTLDSFVQKIIEQDKSAVKELNEILEYYSIRISKSIQPLDQVTASFIYRILTEYAKGIQKYFPEEVKMADHLGEGYIVAVNLQ